MSVASRWRILASSVHGEAAAQILLTMKESLITSSFLSYFERAVRSEYLLRRSAENVEALSNAEASSMHWLADSMFKGVEPVVLLLTQSHL